MPRLIKLQGIRAAERAQLLALCLAALEAQVTALPPGAAAALGGAAQWRQLAAALLALSSLAAASTWLGYVPAQLLTAAAQKLGTAEPAVLQAAGLGAAARAVQQQAAAAAAAAGEDGGSSGGGEESGTAVQWYCLEEKLQLYCSVLRLLTCAFIEPSHQAEQQPYGSGADQAAVAHDGATAETAAAALSPVAGSQAPLPPSPALAEASASMPGARLAGSRTAGGSAELARHQALALLRRQQPGGPLGGIRCSACGASQLFTAHADSCARPAGPSLPCPVHALP